MAATRLLATCTGCQRQWDTRGLAHDERFHCYCGTPVVVPVAKTHESRVVRCAQCGGARHGIEEACSFCGGSFTTHEKDLHTICPSCMARISDRARFCSDCGTAIAPEQLAGERGAEPCPVCGPEQHLWHRVLGDDGEPVLECTHCGGMWLATSSFQRLTDAAKQEAHPELGAANHAAKEARTHTQRPSFNQRGPMYRRCVVCDEHMVRQNYGRVSGVVVDVCRAHGVWLDLHELDAVLGFLRAGGAAKAARAEAERVNELAARPAPAASLPPSMGMRAEAPDTAGSLAVDELLYRALKWFFR